jgi:periplasmic divalent cation tolerance protein
VSAAPADSAARVVLSSCRRRTEAEKIARALVAERLAACVNIVPGVRSIYRWKDSVEETNEVLLVIKTTRGRFPAVAARLAALHSYEVPEILALDADAGAEPYLAWLSDSVDAKG